MDKLTAELQRLHFLDDSPGGEIRVLRVEFFKSADWPAVAALYAALQNELDLPAPAVSVSASDGFGVWLPLLEGVDAAPAMAFLDGLRQRFLDGIPDQRLGLAAGAPAQRVPGPDAASGKWSAFIDPTLGSMFSEQAGLDMAPNMDRQAELLAGVAAIKAADFRRVLAGFSAPGTDPGVIQAPPLGGRTLSVSGRFDDPHSFLLAVMNDPAASPEQRIAAAQALLPYFAGRG